MESGLAVRRAALQDKAAVAIAAFHKAVIADVVVDARMAERPAAAITHHALGLNNHGFGRREAGGGGLGRAHSRTI